jgi:membrane protein required for beta-lactamase induction
MHRCYQFSLRSLLALVLAVGAYCGGWSAARKNVDREVEEARRQATEAAQASREKTLKCFGGSVTSAPCTVDPVVWIRLGHRSDGQSVELP